MAVSACIITTGQTPSSLSRATTNPEEDTGATDRLGTGVGGPTQLGVCPSRPPGSHGVGARRPPSHENRNGLH